jgi:hypothetical protein
MFPKTYFYQIFMPLKRRNIREILTPKGGLSRDLAEEPGRGFLLPQRTTSIVFDLVVMMAIPASLSIRNAHGPRRLRKSKASSTRREITQSPAMIGYARSGLPSYWIGRTSGIRSLSAALLVPRWIH